MKESICARDFLEQLVPERATGRKYKTELLFDISTTILDWRSASGLTQKELADRLGVTQGMISKWESCEYNFTIEQLCKICEKLGLTPHLSFGREVETPQWSDSLPDAQGLPPRLPFAMIA